MVDKAGCGIKGRQGAIRKTTSLYFFLGPSPYASFELRRETYHELLKTESLLVM
jgi:hypothetical protein